MIMVLPVSVLFPRTAMAYCFLKGATTSAHAAASPFTVGAPTAGCTIMTERLTTAAASQGRPIQPNVAIAHLQRVSWDSFTCPRDSRRQTGGKSSDSGGSGERLSSARPYFTVVGR